MNKETIEVPHFDGYKCIGVAVPKKGQYVLCKDDTLIKVAIDYDSTVCPTYERVKPKRYVFEETGEYRSAHYGDLYECDKEISYWFGVEPSYSRYKILKLIED